jgi:hypothetical protein
MSLLFERGDAASPRGHALVYFRAPDDTLYATYVVVPPIAIELGKYLPPMFAAGLGGMSLAPTAAMPFPPLPEPVESLAALERLARLRDDDLVFGGPLASTQPDQLLYVASSTAQSYADQYAAHLERAPAEPAAALPEMDADEVLLLLMSERDRVGELAKRVGPLRYAVEGGDPTAIAEAVHALDRVGRQLTAKYRVDELIVAAQQPGPRGERLAQLYVERAYKLVAEDFGALPALEAAIAAEQG